MFLRFKISLTVIPKFPSTPHVSIISFDRHSWGHCSRIQSQKRSRIPRNFNDQPYAISITAPLDIPTLCDNLQCTRIQPYGLYRRLIVSPRSTSFFIILLTLIHMLRP